jgi:protein-L-isoaspartate(D-aspartate) O-methyltransferase
MATNHNVQEYVDNMVDSLIKQGWLTSHAIREAFRSVPRHLFIDRVFVNGQLIPFDVKDNEQLKMVYSDNSILQKISPPTSSTAPSLMASMLESLELDENMRVLEIGTGSGYNAALIAYIVRNRKLVFTVEIQSDVVEDARRHLAQAYFSHITVIEADGNDGYPPGAPYDRIIVTASCLDVSPHWITQLGERGLLFLPFKFLPSFDVGLKLTKHDRQVIGHFARCGPFMPLHSKCGSGSGEPIRVTPSSPLGDLLLAVKERKAFPFPVGASSCWDDKLTGFFTFVCLAAPQVVSVYNPAQGLMPLCLYDLQNQSAVGIAYPYWDIVVFGNSIMYERLMAMFEEWRDYGELKISEYQVSLLPTPGEPHELNPMWTFVRQHFSYLINVAQTRGDV